MRLSKTSWLILGIGVFVIAFASLYMLYDQQVSEQERLNDSLAVAQATLPRLASETANLENTLTEREAKLTRLGNELVQAESVLDKAAAKFPESVQSIEYGERFFKIADGWGLAIIRFTASEPRDKKVKDVTYFVTSFTVDVKGEVADILGFISTIATSEYFASATIELVTISIPEPVAEGEEKSSATITLVIYGYKGG